jgi:lipoprotein signal peptidase
VSAEPAADLRPGAPRVAVRLAVAAALVALDLWSKAAVFGWLGPWPEGVVVHNCGQPRWPLLGEWLSFMLVYNPGMAWGLELVPTWVLVAGRCLAALFLIWMVATLPATRRLLSWALVLVLAGAVGNLYDNLFTAARREGARFGEVRDFIDVYFGLWDWHFPTFNVADACISVGAVLLLAASLFAREPAAAARAEATA